MKLKIHANKLVTGLCIIVIVASLFFFINTIHDIYKVSRNYLNAKDYIVCATANLTKIKIDPTKNDREYKEYKRNINYIKSIIFTVSGLVDLPKFRVELNKLKSSLSVYEAEIKAIRIKKNRDSEIKIKALYKTIVDNFPKLYSIINKTLLLKRKLLFLKFNMLALISVPCIIFLFASSFLNTKRRIKKISKLKRLYSMHKELTHILSDIIWETDISGSYTLVLGNTKKILGYDNEELIGKTRPNLMPPNEAKKYLEMYYNALGSHNSFSSFINAVLNKKGNFVYFETSALPLFNSKNEIIGFRGIDKDVTLRVKNKIENETLVSELNTLFESNSEENTKLKNEINNLNNKIAKLKKHDVEIEKTFHKYKRMLELKEYIANKHEELIKRFEAELKDPILNIMEISSELIKKKNITKKQIEDIGMVKRSGQKINQLTSTLSEAYRLYSGHFNLNITTFKLSALANILASLYKDILIKRNIEFNIDFDKNIEIENDYEKIKDIIINIIDNISDLKNAKKINIAFDKEKDGIFKIQIRHILKSESFENLSINSKTNQSFELSAKLVEVLNGAFFKETLSNEVVYAITIPCKGYNEKPMPETKVGKNKINVLFAEDDKTNNEYISELLNTFDNINHKSFLNGRLLLDEFEKSYAETDLVILDIQMPVMDGIETLKRIKKIREDIKVFAITAFAMAGDKYKYLNLGFSEYITKPVNHDELENKILKYFDFKA